MMTQSDRTRSGYCKSMILGWIGAKPAEAPWTYVGQAATAYYFAHFLIILPLLAKFETPKPLPVSINEPVLGGGSSTTGAATQPMEKA